MKELSPSQGFIKIKRARYSLDETKRFLFFWKRDDVNGKWSAHYTDLVLDKKNIRIVMPGTEDTDNDPWYQRIVDSFTIIRTYCGRDYWVKESVEEVNKMLGEEKAE